MSEKNQKNLQIKNKNSDTLFRSIKHACEGLIYVSETDAPVDAFRGTAADVVTRNVIIQQTGRKEECPIEEVSFDDFFARLTADKDWFGKNEKAIAKKFLELRVILEENLRDRKVFRLGKIQIDIYAVGVDKDGCLMGVKTKAVET
ncbi:nuclease A inhibitor family protein [soil metagenome]